MDKLSVSTLGFVPLMSSEVEKKIDALAATVSTLNLTVVQHMALVEKRVDDAEAEIVEHRNILKGRNGETPGLIEKVRSHATEFSKRRWLRTVVIGVLATTLGGVVVALVSFVLGK